MQLCTCVEHTKAELPSSIQRIPGAHSDIQKTPTTLELLVFHRKGHQMQVLEEQISF